jgi:hypothetical protein
LGQAYVALGRLTGEPISEFPPLGMMRFAQMTMALHAALARNPEAESAHRALADLYHERGYLDAELVHRQALTRLAREQGAAPGDEDAVDRIALLQKDADELERRVQDNRQLFVVRTQSMGANPYARALEALGLGLALEALDGVLLKSQVLLFGPEGARLQLELLLTLGRAEQARELLDDPELRSNWRKLPVYKLAGISQGKPTGLYLLPAYEWLRACQAAAVGDYDRASAALEAIATQMRGEEAAAAPRLQVEVAHAVLTELGASMPRPSLALMPEARNYLVRRTELLAMVLSLPRQRADLSVLTALLELERGDPARAESLLQAALRETPGPFIARPLAQAYLYRIRAAQR